MPLYIKTVATALLIAAVVGLAAPYLISARSHEAVALGILMLIALPVVLVRIWRGKKSAATTKETEA